MAYIFIPVVYPPAVHDVVQKSLGRLIETIEAGKPISSWVHLAEQSREPVLYYLKQWKDPAVEEYSNNQKLRAFSTRHIRLSDMRGMQVLMSLGMRPPEDEEAIPRGCEDDRVLAEKLNVLTPPKDYDTGDGPELKTLLDAIKSNPDKSTTNALDEYIATHWKTNVTQLDLDWEHQWKADYSEFVQEEMHSGIGFHPVKVAKKVTRLVESLNGKRVNTTERLAAFFEETAQATEDLIAHASLVIEVICGELADVMEKLQYDCYEGRGRGASTGGETNLTPENGPDVSKFPKTFDRIHLSNIPDYVGGPMNPFLYARPLLKPFPAANLRFNNLLNCSSFDNLDHFHAEYTLLPSESLISKQFQLLWEPTHPDIKQFTQMGYMVWNVTPSNINPKDKTLDTAILRTLSTGTFTTTARPPTELVTDISDLEKTHPAKQMTIAAYLAELSTLLSLFRPLIPFGFALAESATIPPAKIVECKVLFKGGFKKAHGLRMSRFKIVLCKTSLQGQPPTQLRDLLANEKKDDVEKLKKGGIHVVSAFKYTAATETACFWLREDVVDQILRENWMVYIWRTDSWGKQGPGVKAEEFLVKGRTWVDGDSDSDSTRGRWLFTVVLTGWLCGCSSQQQMVELLSIGESSICPG